MKTSTAARLAIAGLLTAAAVVAAEPALAAVSSQSATTAPTTAAASTVKINTVAATTTTGTAAATPAATTVVTPAATAASTVAAVPAAAVTSRVLAIAVRYQAYTLSCEESALRMALSSEGINVTDAQVLATIGTDLRVAYTDATGLRWGDPYTTFVGSPSGSETNLTGYGTYYPTIAKAAAVLGGNVLAAGEGISPATVYSDILSGHPVVAWVTYQWVTPARHDYTAFDGRVIPYAGPVEHAVTVVGVTPTTVYINNPDFGLQVISKSLFEATYATYNDMAVVLN